MTAKLSRIAGLLLIAGVAFAEAAPNIPPGEMPGRDRQRVAPSPVERFTDPLAWPRQAEPLWRWCDEGPTRRTKKKAKQNKGC